MERIRGQQRLVRRMVQPVEEDAAGVSALRLGSIYTDNEGLLSMLSQQLDRIGNLGLEYIGKLGGVITSHVGPETIGVSYYPKEV